jgi:hypothetical protein
MSITQGFQIEQPSVFIPWGVSERGLRGLLASSKLRQITKGHYSISCVSLGGLAHELDFHFKPRLNGELSELELRLRDTCDHAASFKRLQKHVESYFGVPTETKHVRQVFPEYSYTWKIKGIIIEHHVINRNSEVDCVRIKRS